MVVRGEDVGYRYISTGYGRIDIENDIVKPLFSPAASHLADNPKIFLSLAISGFEYINPPDKLQRMFPASGGNYIAGHIHCSGADLATSTILRALKSPQQSVQDIFKSLRHKIRLHGRMTVIDHLNEPVYLHPDAPQGTHSGPGKPHPPHNTSHTLPPYRTHQEAAR